MIAAQVVAEALALAACPPFDRLTETELLLVASHARRFEYEPGETVLAGGAVAQRLVAVVGGSVVVEGRQAPAVFDAPSALFGLPTRADYIAGGRGAQVLCLARPHLFTIARECPDFVVGLAAIRAGADA
ncbi:Crp/Fnr family transcriptional regulator [Novosphingobium pentaromativorans]|nr:Crp/Fnr family transcriptional regulator [Novosphingobium pentaromativorans]